MMPLTISGRPWKDCSNPLIKEHFLGRAQVIQVFNVHKVGMIAGSLVIDGKVVRGSHARLLRDNVIVFDGRIASLRRFKDDMKDCSQGLECGIGIENFNDVKLGDIIESYEVEEIQSPIGLSLSRVSRSSRRRGYS